MLSALAHFVLRNDTPHTSEGCTTSTVSVPLDGEHETGDSWSASLRQDQSMMLREDTIRSLDGRLRSSFTSSASGKKELKMLQ